MGMACMLSAVLSPLLIHAYGLIGAALALVVTEFLMAALITVRLARVGYKYKPDAHLARLGVAAIGMCFVVKCLVGLNLGLAVIGGGLFYTLFLFVGRVFDAEDVGWMLSLVRGRETSGKEMRIM